MVEAETVSLLHKRGVRQFIKFCIVGASSFAIDAGISTLLAVHLGIWWVAARTFSFILAVTNGFFWNQRWTFRAVGHRRQHEQYTMFFMVNIVGLVLNLTIMKLVFRLMTGGWHRPILTTPHGKLTWYAALLSATVIVVFWNFFANKLWTFKNPDK
jgi:putative flippase GtrA